jgi:DNA-binding response OmpR family regulator
LAKIIVLEDESNLAELLKELLQFEQYEVQAPRTFNNALANIEDYLPDGIIIDVHLNELNGLDLIEEIRKSEKLSNVYILALSGMDHSHSAKESGANDFLLKPFIPDEIINLLKENVIQ